MDVSAYTAVVALFRKMKESAVSLLEASIWAYSYLRFSDPSQAKGDSLGRQSDALGGWLKRHPDVQLDKTLKAWDRKAISGFTAEHRTNPKYVLAQFMVHVNSGRVRAGSYLIVENLDRLTREKWNESVPYVLELISKGIRIVQLSPIEIVYDLDMDQGRLMMMLMELGRAHSESAMKSERVGEAWRKKKLAARQGIPHGKRVPAWIELVDGEYRLRPDASRTIQAIVKWSTTGLGSLAIRRRLDLSGFKPITGQRWTRSYISKILHSRTLIGEYQPMKGHGSNRAPDGEPISNYYPPVVTEAQFYACLNAQTSRTGRSGRPPGGGGPASLFAGLLHSANDGRKLSHTRRKKRSMLVSLAAVEGEANSCWVYFPLDHLTDGILSQLKELSAADLFNDPDAAQVAELNGKLREVEKRLAVAIARYKASPESTTWGDQIDACDAEKRTLKAELMDAIRKAQHPVSATWEEAIKLMREEEPGRLRQCLLETVSAIWVLFLQIGRGVKLAAVQVYFEGGGRRDYLILSRLPLGWNTRHQKGEYVARSLTGKVAGEFDLRDREQAAELGRLLAKVDVATF